MDEKDYLRLAPILDEYRKINIFEDSIYRDFSVSPASLFQSAPMLRHRVILMGSGSKVHALAGERVGYVIAPVDIAPKIASAEMSRPSVTAQEMLVTSEERLKINKSRLSSLYNEKVHFFLQEIQNTGMVAMD